MADAFFGEVRILPYSFPPRGWTPCNGQLLPIAQNQALYAIIGSIYGGDGRTTMAVPNLMGRAPMGVGAGPGLTPRYLGKIGGTSGVELNVQQIPIHKHSIVNVHWDSAEATTAERSFLGRMNGSAFYKADATTTVAMSQSSLSVSGSSQQHENRQPFLAMQFCLCLDGTFTSRN